MRRLFGLGLAFAATLGATAAWATPIPRLQDLLAEPTGATRRPLPVRSLTSATPFTSTRVVAIDTTLDLEPETGVINGSVEVELASLATTSSFALLLDPGLSVSTATGAGRTLSVQNSPYQGSTYATISISPSLAPGETLRVSADFSGTLNCGQSTCKVGGPLGFLIENSAVPGVVDQDGIGGYNAWGAARSLTISVPSGTAVVASGDQVSSSETAGTSTTVWAIPGFPSLGGNVVMFGDLSSMAVSGANPKSDIYSVSGSTTLVNEMSDWMQSILPFMDAQAGQPLPYAELKVFKLPLGWLNIFRGTAGYGLTLLSEDYARGGNAYFEETLAHENAHQWWGVLVSPSDLFTTSWLVEGLATQSQIDYAAEHLNPLQSREAYLARRYREHWITVKYMGDPSIPLVTSSYLQVPTDSILHTLWAYIRSSAMLEHLRVLVGDDAYAATLRSWAETCGQEFCDTTDFLNVIETSSGQDLRQAFDQYVWGGRAVEPRLSFTQTGPDTLSVKAAGIEGQTLALRLEIRLHSGEVEEQLVSFVGSQPAQLAVSGQVLSVRPNPRHDGFVWSRSAQAGDLNFDGEVDGLDVIHCAWRKGKRAERSQQGGEGLWGLDLDFDPRADENGDGTIDGADLAVVTSAFGTVKEGP